MWEFEANQKLTAGRAACPRCRWSSSITLCPCAEKWQQKELVAALAEPQPGAGKSQGAISSRKGDVGRWKQPSRMEMCLHRQPGPAGMKPSALQELHLGAALAQRDWVCFSQTCTIFHSVPPKHCSCPAHFNVHGKSFSSRCSYLELNNCLQLYEHHIKNTNKGNKNTNLCSIMLWLTGAKNLSMHWDQHSQHVQAQFPRILSF